MIYSSLITISRSALENNLKYLKKVFGKKVKFSSVVKGNAYGHGIESFVPLAESFGINHFSVFSADEALRILRIKNNSLTVMIMGYIDNDELEWAVKNEIQFFVFELDRLEHAVKVAKRLKKKAKIHIELETGMNRTGFDEKELDKVFEILKKNKRYIELTGLCTHYAGAESIANYLRIQKQIKKYNKYYKRFAAEDLQPKIRHTACSAAAMTYPKTRMDLVRIGILQYGFWPTKETLINFISKKEEKVDPLRRVISWKSKVLNTKYVSTGEFIGYGTTYLAQREMKIATVPVGYSHGFSRSLSNQGRVLIRGERMAVIGMVNMNLMTVDITNKPEIRKGDEVILIGSQNDLEISVASFAELSDQLNYELLTRIPDNIPRLIDE